MKPTYYVDTNVVLRFLLADNKRMYQRAKDAFRQAKEGEIKLVFLPEVVIEVNYVLQKVYSLTKSESAEELAKIVQTPYLDVMERSVLINAISKYKKLNVDFVDLILYEKAKAANAKLLSFDETDMRKISKLNAGEGAVGTISADPQNSIL